MQTPQWWVQNVGSNIWDTKVWGTAVARPNLHSTSPSVVAGIPYIVVLISVLAMVRIIYILV